MRYLLSAYLGTVCGAVVGALIGFGVQQITGQEGWALVVAAIGANAGAFWAGLRRASGQPIWRVRAPGAFRLPVSGDSSDGA